MAASKPGSLSEICPAEHLTAQTNITNLIKSNGNFTHFLLFCPNITSMQFHIKKNQL